MYRSTALPRYFFDLVAYVKNSDSDRFRHRISLAAAMFLRFERQLRVCLALARPSLFPLARRQPQLFVKYLKRNYLALNLSVDLRAGLLVDHYRLLEELLDRRTVAGLLAPGPILWEHRGDEGLHQIALQFSETPYHEGELSLCYRLAGEPIYWLGFSLLRGARLGLDLDRAAFVSRIQLWSTYPVVKRAAHDAHGVFPLYAMFAALKGLAEAWRLDGVIGVDAASQASSQEKLYSAERAYDDLFASLGAVRVETAFCPARLRRRGEAFARMFLLPSRQSEAEAEAKKPCHGSARQRSLFRRDIREKALISACALLSARFRAAPARPRQVAEAAVSR